MSVVPFKRRSNLAVTEGYGPDAIRFGVWLTTEVLRWMKRTPAELRREALNFLTDSEIDDIEAQRHLSRRKTANG